MHLSSYQNMQYFVKKYLDSLRKSKINILDVGSCDVNGTYRDLFKNKNWNYTGLDMERGKNVDIVPDNKYEWREIKDLQFDVVVSGQAFEHIEFFWLTIKEISRIMKNNAFLCIIAPSSGYEHKYPVDCWRFYPDGMRSLAKYANLKTLEAFADWNNKDKIIDEVWKDCVLIAQK